MPTLPKTLRSRGLKRILLGAVLFGGFMGMIDQWLPHALISHHNRAVNPEPELLELLEPEVLKFAVDYERSGPVFFEGWLLRSPMSQSELSRSPTLILLHSLGGTREDLLEFALPFREAGFNLVLMDLRSHGESGGKFFTYGVQEAKDISILIDELAELGLNHQISVLGVSVGGAVAIAAAAQDDRIASVITLGTFADLEETIVAQTPYLPFFWRERAVARAEEMAGFSVEKASPVRNLAQVKIPLLLMHGDRDTYIPPENAKRLFEAAAGSKEIYRIPEATHSNLLKREEVRLQILNWLESQPAEEEKLL